MRVGKILGMAAGFCIAMAFMGSPKVAEAARPKQCDVTITTESEVYRDGEVECMVFRNTARDCHGNIMWCSINTFCSDGYTDFYNSCN